jgi:hypothetical protein
MHYKSGDLQQKIIANTDYAEYIEYGTTRIKVGTIDDPLIYTSTRGKYPSYRPFLRPALYMNLERIMKYFDEQLGEK